MQAKWLTLCRRDFVFCSSDGAWIGGKSRLLCDLVGAVDCRDGLIFVCPVAAGVVCGTIGEPVQVRLSELGVAAAAASRDLDEPQRYELADSWRDHAFVHAEFLEVLIGARKLAVVLAAVVRVLDLEPGKNQVRSAAQNAVGRRFEHGDRSGGKLPGDRVLAPWLPSHVMPPSMGQIELQRGDERRQ